MAALFMMELKHPGGIRKDFGEGFAAHYVGADLV
jgi:hypothetical protein